MFKRMVNWIMFTVTFALLPLIVFAIIEYVFEYDRLVTFKYISELFVFTIMISSTTLKEIFSNELSKLKDGYYLAFFLILLLFTILSALLYGTVLLSDMLESSDSSLIKLNADKILVLSIILSLGSFIIGTIVQIMEELK